MSIHQHAAIGDTLYFWAGSNNTSGSGADGTSPVYDVREAGASADASLTSYTGDVPSAPLPQINSLSGEITNLFEHMYSLGDGVGSPDARETPGWLFFMGQQGGGETPPRDYREQLSRHTTISTSALQVRPDPADIINLMQTNKVTHAAWITSTNWTGVKSAIQADPLLHTTCPTRYGSCET